MLKWFDEEETSKLNLIEIFPSRQILRLQTDFFAERRSRALDAYLQILTHCLRERDLLDHVIIKEFFGLDRRAVGAGTSFKKLPALKTPNALNIEIEKLRSALFTSKDLKSLHPNFSSLQETISGVQERGNSEDLKCVEKFYELKREWEEMKIRSGEYEGSGFEFDLCSGWDEKQDMPMGTLMGAGPATGRAAGPVPDSTGESASNPLNYTKRHLREQEAILSDLAESLQQQKQVSLEICEEIIQQNRVMSEFGKKQEGTIGEFVQSTGRARKLQ